MNETKRYWDLLDWNKEELVNHIIDLEKYSNEDKKEIRNLKQLQNNWNELKKWLEDEIDYCSGTDDMDFISMKNAYESTMLEMQELEQGKDE